MGSCLSKCYSGAGPALANAETDAVKEKHVVVSHAPPPIPLPNCQVNSNNVNVSVSSSSSCSSSDPSSPNSSATPSNSFSSLSANCSSCQHSPPSSSFKESSKGLYLHQTALRSLPEKLCSSQAAKQPLARGNNKLQVRAASVGERRSSPASRSRTVVLRSAPQLERSKSLATGGDRFGRVQVATAARKKLAGRPPIIPGKSTSRQGRLTHRKEEEEMHSMQRSLQMREIIGSRRWRDGFDVDQGQSYAVEDLNNPLIAMDCFIFI